MKQKNVIILNKMKLIKFSAPWCGPCKVYEKTFDKVAETYKDKVEIEKYLVEESEDKVEEYHVRNIPTTIIVNDEGTVVFQKVGIIKESELINEIEACLK